MTKQPHPPADTTVCCFLNDAHFSSAFLPPPFRQEWLRRPHFLNPARKHMTQAPSCLSFLWCACCLSVPHGMRPHQLCWLNKCTFVQIQMCPGDGSCRPSAQLVGYPLGQYLLWGPSILKVYSVDQQHPEPLGAGEKCVTSPVAPPNLLNWSAG